MEEKQTDTKVRKVAGVIAIKPKVVDLSEFFDHPVTVTVRPLPVPARARLQELMTDGVRYATTQRKRSLDIDAIEQSMPAEITIEIREVKLAEGVIEHDMLDTEGGRLPWEKDLWDQLDEANPCILDKVVEEISEITYPEEDKGKDEGQGKDPTSPTGKRRR